MHSKSTRLFLPGAVALALCGGLLGCGGGGGGGSSPNTTTFTGTVVNASKSPLVGYRLTFNQGPSATTDNQGRYSLTVPHSALGGTVTLTVTDSSGTVVDVETLTTGGSQSTVTENITVNLTPPGQPGL